MILACVSDGWDSRSHLIVFLLRGACHGIYIIISIMLNGVNREYVASRSANVVRMAVVRVEACNSISHNLGSTDSMCLGELVMTR